MVSHSAIAQSEKSDDTIDRHLFTWLILVLDRDSKNYCGCARFGLRATRSTWAALWFTLDSQWCWDRFGCFGSSCRWSWCFGGASSTEKNVTWRQSSEKSTLLTKPACDGFEKSPPQARGEG